MSAAGFLMYLQSHDLGILAAVLIGTIAAWLMAERG